MKSGGSESESEILNLRLELYLYFKTCIKFNSMVDTGFRKAGLQVTI